MKYDTYIHTYMRPERWTEGTQARELRIQVTKQW